MGTGGQQSLLRALLGVFLLARFVRFLDGPLPVAALALVAAASATGLAAGWRTRACTGTLLAAWFLLAFFDPRTVAPFTTLLAVMALVHAMVPVAPYGSLDARGRADPGGGWEVPSLVTTFLWVALVGGYLVSAKWSAAGATTSRWALAKTILLVAFPLAALLPRSRPWVWAAGFSGHLAGAVAGGGAFYWPLAMALLHLHVFEREWIAPRRGAPDRIFYDGDCGLCHRAVRFVVAEDLDGELFRFSPLGGPLHRETFPESERAPLAGAVALRTPDGRTLTRSAAALRILDRLGGCWRILAWGGAAVPAPLLDLAYDVVARVRRRLFPRPGGWCPVDSERLRGRFEE